PRRRRERAARAAGRSRRARRRRPAPRHGPGARCTGVCRRPGRLRAERQRGRPRRALAPAARATRKLIYAMSELATVTVVRNETEAEMVSALLRTAGVRSFHRQTNAGAGFGDGMPQ